MIRINHQSAPGYAQTTLRDLKVGETYIPAYLPDSVGVEVARNNVYMVCEQGSDVDTNTAGVLVCRLRDGFVFVTASDQCVTLVDCTMSYTLRPKA